MLTNSGTINDQHGSDHDSQNDHIRIIQLNIQSVHSKIADLRFDIQTNTLEFDILLISETWLKPTIPNRFLNIRDYKLIRSDRPTTSTQSQGYGGVGILMKTSIPHEVLDVQKNKHWQQSRNLMGENNTKTRSLTCHSQCLQTTCIYRETS